VAKKGKQAGKKRLKQAQREHFAGFCGQNGGFLGDQTAKKGQRGKRITPMARAWRWVRSTIKNAWNMGIIV
jgi:hypothetical protein